MRVEQSAVWGDFVAMQEALHARLSRELQSGARLSEADYAVLAVLNRRRQISTRPVSYTHLTLPTNREV